MYTYNLRGIGTTLSQPNFNLKWMKNSFTYTVSKLWNKLPTEVKQAANVVEFKTKLSKVEF